MRSDVDTSLNMQAAMRMFCRRVGLLLVTLHYCVVVVVQGQVLGVDRQYKCDWQLELVNRRLGVTKYVTPDTSLYEDITSIISNVDLTPDDTEVELYAYDNNLRIKLNCAVQSDEQAYVAQGGTPIISVYYPPQTTFDQTAVGPVVREMYGALIDAQEDGRIEVNSPAWVVPLPLDSCHSILGVNTRGEGGGEILPNTKSFEVVVASLTDSSGVPDTEHVGAVPASPPSGADLTAYFNEPKPSPTFVPVYNSGLVYGPVNADGIYLFTYTDFSNDQDAKFISRSNLAEGGGVCSACFTNADHPRLLAALPQRILMFAKDGLTEVRGNFVHMDSTGNKVIKQSNIESSKVDSSICLSQLIVNSQIDLLQEWMVVGVGACDQKDKLFTADVKHSLDSPLSLTEVTDLDLESLCGADCEIITAVVWAEGISKITILTTSPTRQEYYLIDYTQNRNSNNNTVTTVVTAKIAYAQREDPGLGEAVVVSLDGEPQPAITTPNSAALNPRLQLTGLSLRPYSSNDIFLWGNRILYSPDRGRTVMLLPWPATTPPPAGASNREIRALPVSQSGMFAVLVHNTAPAAGANPTEIWMSYTSQPTEFYQVYETNDFYVAISHESTDQNRYLWPPDSTIVSIWWQQDIYQEDMLKVLGYSGSSPDGLSGIQNQEVSAHTLIEMIRDLGLEHTDLQVSAALELVFPDERPDKCPVENIVFEMPSAANTLKLQELTYKPPRAYDGTNETILYSDNSILAYHSVVIYLDQLQDDAISSSYLNTDYNDTTEQWQGEMGSSVAYRDYVFQYGQAPGGFDIDIDDYTKNYPHFEDGSEPQITQLPDNIYLGHKETFSFLVHFILKDQYYFWDYTKTDYTAYIPYFYNEDFDREGNDATLSVSVSDPNLIDIRKEFVRDDLGDKITYKITMTDNGKADLSMPGTNLVPVGLQLVAHNSPFRCYTDFPQFGYTPLGIQRTNVIVGCAPQLRIQFDAFETVKAINSAGNKYFDCPINSDPKMPCFYFQTEFLPRFRIQDLLTGSSKRYNGKYSLRVIGGSEKSIEDIKNFSEEEIFKYNNKNAKGTGLVFGHSSGQYTDDGWPLFTAGTQSVVWLCLSESPCADVNPKFPLPPEYFFLVRFSNVGTGEDATNCNLELDFVVRVHGLPINFYKKSLPLFLGTMFVMFLYIIIYYVCHRNDDRIYNQVRVILRRYKERITPKKEIDDAFLAEYRANFQKQRMIAKKVTAVRRPGETIELGLSYQGLSFLRAAHADATGDAKLPELEEEDEEEEDVPAPPADTTGLSPYLPAFAITSQPQSAAGQSANQKQFNPMKGKVREVSVRKKELFSEAEELVEGSYHSMIKLPAGTPSDEELERDIIHPKKTPEVTVEEEGGERLLNVIEPPVERGTVQTRTLIGPDGKRTVKTIRRMSRTIKVPKSEALSTAAGAAPTTTATTEGQHTKTVVKRRIIKKTKGGEVKVEETVPFHPDLADDQLMREHSETIVKTALKGAKKSLSQESLKE